MAEAQITTGIFTNVASTPFFIPVPNQIVEFTLKNLTRSGVTIGSVDGVLTADRIVEAWINASYMNQGTALIKQTGAIAGSLAPLSIGNLAQNGFTIIDNNFPIVYAPVAIASFVPGVTTVWTTSANHLLQVGDIVRVYSLTSAPQFGGLAMTVTAVGSATTFTTLLDSTGATTSVGFMQKVGMFGMPFEACYYPQLRVIADITNSNPMVVTTLVQMDYHPGDVVTFDMPTIFGMPQLSQQLTGLPVNGTVIEADNTIGVQTVTIAIDSTNFGVFATSSVATVTNPGAWPLAPGYPFSFPYLVPQGEGNLNNFQLFGVVPVPLPYGNQNVLSFARQNQCRNGILIGAGTGTLAGAITDGIIGATVDVWHWECITSSQEFPPAP